MLDDFRPVANSGGSSFSGTGAQIVAPVAVSVRGLPAKLSCHTLRDMAHIILIWSLPKLHQLERLHCTGGKSIQ